TRTFARRKGLVMFGLLKLVDQIGQTKDLDTCSKPLSDVVSKATARDAVTNALSGTWLGHQLHPMLTDLPIGAWTMASALDITRCGHTRLIRNVACSSITPDPHTPAHRRLDNGTRSGYDQRWHHARKPRNAWLVWVS